MGSDCGVHLHNNGHLETHVLARVMEMSRSSSPTVAISSVRQSPALGCDTAVNTENIIISFVCV